MTTVIERRFRGPPASGNGGYSCGVVAAGLDGPAEVTLRAPPPLDTPIEVAREGDRLVARVGDLVLAEAVPTRLDSLEVPAPVELAAAEAAARGYLGFHEHPYPGCFVCGPERTDGLRIFPGPVAGRKLAAAPWTPDASLAVDGVVRPEILWAALDCPSWFGAASFERHEGSILLGRLAAELLRLPRAGERCVALGWPIASEGRKVTCGSAVYTADGELLGRARALWIKPR